MKVGFVGWRGMVGSVLMDRMQTEGDLDGRFEARYFSTSQVGQAGPDGAPLRDASDLNELGELDVVMTCQGGAYSEEVAFALRARGWDGHWIDAASRLRLEDESVIVLDPVNRPVIDRALSAGNRTWVGANCTVSLLLMAVDGLLRAGAVEWISSMTYQAASGAGARHMRELVAGMGVLGGVGLELDPAQSVLELDRRITETMRSDALPTERFGAPLAASLIPWIDRAVDGGRTREEWKGMVEANKILATQRPIPIDGICVRVGAMRCHSQGLTIKLNQDLDPSEAEQLLADANPWVRVVPNTHEATLSQLTPAAVTGTLDIPIGRIHALAMGPRYLGAFTVGDQLLWGAAEPLRRMLQILLDES